jgi:hypothetical protein
MTENEENAEEKEMSERTDILFDDFEKSINRTRFPPFCLFLFINQHTSESEPSGHPHDKRTRTRPSPTITNNCHHQPSTATNLTRHQ